MTQENLPKPPNDFAAYETLTRISNKLRAVAYLIECEGDEGPYPDMDNIRWGIGLILTEVSFQIRHVANDLEVRELGQVEKRKKKRSRKKRRSK